MQFKFAIAMTARLIGVDVLSYFLKNDCTGVGNVPPSRPLQFVVLPAVANFTILLLLELVSRRKASAAGMAGYPCAAYLKDSRFKHMLERMIASSEPAAVDRESLRLIGSFFVLLFMHVRSTAIMFHPCDGFS